MTFKHAFVEKDLNKTTALLRQYFDQCGYSDCNVAVWGYEQLNNVIEKNYPALLLDIKTSLTNSDCTLYKTISQRSDLRNKYFEDERRKNIISEVQKLLKAQNKNNKAMHIRILGASGIGKTKTVVQILDDNDLKCNCIFFRSPEEYNNSTSLKNYINENKNVSLILVIDECDSRNAGQIFNAIEYNVINVKLITIYNSLADTSVGADKVFTVEELLKPALLELIKKDYPTLPIDTCNKIVRLCEGFPRVAMIVAENVSKNPEQYLENLDNIWLKYVSDEKSINSNETKDKIRILEYFSLFERIGFKGTFSSEFDFVCSKIKEDYSAICNGDIKEHIAKLKDSNILRGETTLYISPRIFQNWLQKKWWKKNADTFKYEKFVESMPEPLIKFFNNELSGCPPNIKDIILQQFNNYNDIMTKKKLFQCIAYPKNKNVFKKLREIIEDLNIEELSNIDGDIQSVLAYYAKDPSYFIKSCDLLFKIEISKNRNTYESFFTDLFTIFYNTKMANTYTPLEDKINYLNGLAESRKEEKEVLIILRAIEQGMQDPMCVNKLDDSAEITIQFLIQFNFTNIELKYIDDLFKLTLTILDKNTNIEIIKKCNYIFNSTALYLLKTNETCEIALNHYKTLINTKKCDVFELIKNLNNTLEEHNCKELNEENIVKLREFLGDLKKLNKIDDFKIFCMQNRHVSDEKKELFNDLVDNANFKEDEMLEFLFSDKSKLSFDVGIKKSANDNDLIAYKKIIEKYVELKTPKNIDLIFGYFCGLCEKDQDTFDDIVLKIDCKSPLYAILPDIVNVSPTDKTVNYLFNLIKSNKFSITDLKSRISKCSKQLLTEIIEYIITKEKPVIYLCLTLISYNKDKIKFDEELVLKCLYISIEEVFKKHINTVYIYLWNEILNEYVNSKSSLERLLEIFERIIIISSDLSSKLEKDSLLFLAKLHPQEMWEKLSSILDNNEQNISRLFNIKNCWLSNGFLSIFDESSILKWIDEKENSRLNIISCLAPYYFLPTKKESDMAFYRRLLIKYPENKRLKQELRAQAMSGFSWGKTIDNLNEKISNIKNLMEDEEEEIIKDWLDKLLDCYNKILKCEKEVAERRNF